jgi:hypothetical protein
MTSCGQSPKEENRAERYPSLLLRMAAPRAAPSAKLLRGELQEHRRVTSDETQAPSGGMVCWMWYLEPSIDRAAHTFPYRLSAISGEHMNLIVGFENHKSQIANLIGRYVGGTLNHRSTGPPTLPHIVYRQFQASI